MIVVYSTVALLMLVMGTLFLKYLEPQKYLLDILDRFKPVLDTKVSPVFETSSDFENNLYSELKNTINVSSVEKLNDNTYKITSDSGLIVLIDPTKPLSSQVNSLQTILTHSRIEKRLPSKIDLRFSKVAIEYNR
ncbi:MAG: hypothetical protein A3F33_01530 [Candidatus Woykebacteria bacterium RIFCSPHIGHO2_12_FULL_43_10]|nr:MAG: hypothetical protein A2802_01030 [Candidatus Woykebacteria bacterium RIFCSPHIGHO2_01_FULL_43_29]OGY29135.1 MAG: hypothetical protein A3F33_01530 [Candidatus Woykebacteria bacterium RIFCSPHIGHO2_12_FULL_43_10]